MPWAKGSQALEMFRPEWQLSLRSQDSLEGDAIAQAAPAHLSHQGACEDRKSPDTLRAAA